MTAFVAPAAKILPISFAVERTFDMYQKKGRWLRICPEMNEPRTGNKSDSGIIG